MKSLHEEMKWKSRKKVSSNFQGKLNPFPQMKKKSASIESAASTKSLPRTMKILKRAESWNDK